MSLNFRILQLNTFLLESDLHLVRDIPVIGLLLYHNVVNQKYQDDGFTQILRYYMVDF